MPEVDTIASGSNGWLKPNRNTLNTRYLGQLLVLLGAVLLSDCQPISMPLLSEPKWIYTDLRILDEADASNPEQDFLAGYLRLLGNELQIRLDFLDLNTLPATDLYLALDSMPGGTEELPWHQPVALAWDALLVIPASGELQVLGPDQTSIPGSGLRVVRDPIQDTITISILADSLPGKFLPARLQVFSTPSGSTTISDESGVFFSDGVPPDPAPVLMVFWDTLPAYTPALSLRRWDGAHTGPLGGRHGLYNLLRTARARNIPLVLLDLKTPASLSALDYVEGLSMVAGMADRGQLILPEVQLGFIPDQDENASTWLQVYGWNQADFLDRGRKLGAAFGLPVSPFIYSPAGLSSAFSGSSRLTFTFNPQLNEPQRTRWQQQAVLELPLVLPPAVPTIDGPDLAMRRQLIQAALDPTNRAGSDLTVLGGDLPASAWGNPEIARATFSYLVSHPWIRLLNAYDLLGLPIPEIEAQPAAITSTGDASGFPQSLETAPKNSLGQAAQQAYASLYAPVYPHPSELPALRAAYLGVVQVLLTAARWAEEPAPIQDCTADIDLDGQPECLLGSTQLLAVIQPENGELSFLFAIGKNGPHQLVGPGYQFISGLSEPKSWKLGAGLDSDPGAAGGAFRDPVQPGTPPNVYSLQEGAGNLVFESQENSLRKIYWSGGCIS